MERRHRAGFAIAPGAVVTLIVLARRWQLRWGATAEDRLPAFITQCSAGTSPRSSSPVLRTCGFTG